MGRLRRDIDVIEYSVSKKFRLVKIFPQESFHLMNKNLYHRMLVLTISNKYSGEFWFVCITRKIIQKKQRAITSGNNKSYAFCQDYKQKLLLIEGAVYLTRFI